MMRLREGISIGSSAADRERLAAAAADQNGLQKHVWRARIILATAGVVAWRSSCGAPKFRSHVRPKHQTVSRRVEIQPDHVTQLDGKSRSPRQLETPVPMRLEAVAAQIRSSLLSIKVRGAYRRGSEMSYADTDRSSPSQFLNRPCTKTISPA